MRVILSCCVFICFLIAEITLAQSQEDSMRLAWAVRRLVANTCNSSSSAISAPCVHCNARPGKIGPHGQVGRPGITGPKGDKGSCSCDQSENEELSRTVQNLQNKINAMEAMMPEVFCLLGMKSGKIQDSAITASSIHSAAYCQLGYARLDHHGAWCAVSNTIGSQWVQVDLGKIQKVTGVVTQGQGNYPGTDEWITSFKIEYGTISGHLISIIENRNAKVFSPANFNKNTKVVTRFPHPVNARYIRIIPASYRGHMSMRFEVINC